MGLLELTVGRRALWACLAVAVACFWAEGVSAQFFSPGELSKSHAALEGDAHCADCHSAGSRVSDEKCMICHDDVGRSVKKKTGLHGHAFLGKPCGSCHVDHRGKEHDLVRWDQKAFDHAQSGWPLVGAHARLQCAKCHTGTNSRSSPTFIGLSNGCAACHKDVHEGRFGAGCQSCHSQKTFDDLQLTAFDHDRARFALRGKHQQVACQKCHGEPAKYRPLTFAACGDCHQDPHRGKLGAACESCHGESSWKAVQMQRAAHPGLSLEAGHARVACKTCHDRGNLLAPSRGSRCVSCHAAIHTAPFGDDCAQCHAQIRWFGLPEALARRAHARTRYPLEGKHEDATCASCHSPKRPLAKRYRGLHFGRCLDCHRDAHRAEFAARDAGECSACHTTAGFATTSFGVEQHGSTHFALTGGHEATPCGTCHTQKRPRLDWHVSKQACADCHANPHGSQFEQQMSAGGCAACHSTSAWDVPNIAHESWPLTGAHARVRCDGCHSATEADRRAGNGVSYKAAPRDCEGCHEDAHLGQFRLSEPAKACADCHDTTKFALPGFDHAARTGYTLAGKHEKVACKACHVRTTLASGETTSLWRLPYRACKDCHKDPHSEGP
jgi:hypothetical protein